MLMYKFLKIFITVKDTLSLISFKILHSYPIILHTFWDRFWSLISWASLLVLLWLPQCPELTWRFTFYDCFDFQEEPAVTECKIQRRRSVRTHWNSFLSIASFCIGRQQEHLPYFWSYLLKVWKKTSRTAAKCWNNGRISMFEVRGD